MQLNVINSGSSGNGYIIQDNKEALIVECGEPVKGAVKILGYNQKKVAGCLITHSHGDHAKYIKQYAQLFNIYATRGTLEEKGIAVNEFHYNIIPLLKEFKVGNFTIKAFDTKHDTKEPCGFIINHTSIGNMLFLTDSHHIKYKFTFPFDYILIECNHTDKLVDKSVSQGIIPANVAIRTKATHMSLERCVKCLKEINLVRVKAIVLIHLSRTNADENLFQSEVAKATGKPVYVARKGLVLDMF